MNSKHEQERKSGKLQMWLLIGAAVIALSAATFETYAKEGVVYINTDVPEVVEEAKPVKKGWYDPRSWPTAVIKRWNEKEVMHDTIETLDVQLEQANRELLGFNKLIEQANKQEKKVTNYYEGLLKAARLEVGTFRSKNEALNQAIKDLETKDSSMTWVPGCWVSNESVQAATP